MARRAPAAMRRRREQGAPPSAPGPGTAPGRGELRKENDNETDESAADRDGDDLRRGRGGPGQDAGLLQRGLARRVRPRAVDRGHELRRLLADDLQPA